MIFLFTIKQPPFFKNIFSFMRFKQIIFILMFFLADDREIYKFVSSSFFCVDILSFFSYIQTDTP